MMSFVQGHLSNALLKQSTQICLQESEPQLPSLQPLAAMDSLIVTDIYTVIKVGWWEEVGLEDKARKVGLNEGGGVSSALGTMASILTDSKYGARLRVSFAATKHRHQKARWGGKGLFYLHFDIAVHH